MAHLDTSVLDAALNIIDDNVTHLYICSQEPTTYAGASSTYALGNEDTITCSDPTTGDTSGGRKITISAITSGTVTANGTATHWALTSGSVLLATAALGSSQAVTSGNTFTLTAFDIELPDPT